MKLTPDQQSAIDPAASVWVAASAGTGKTKVLADRTLRLLLAGTPPGRILCLTFTKAAAAEMSIRIAARLSRWTRLEDMTLAAELESLCERPADDDLCAHARRLFGRVLDAPGGMKIQTIHSFCQSLLRRFPLEAGMAPHFELMDDRSAEEMLLTAREEVLADPAFAESVSLLTAFGQERTFGALMDEIAAERGRLARLLDEHGGLEGLLVELRTLLGLAEGMDEGTVLAAACTEGAFEGPLLRAVCRAMAEAGKSDRNNGALIAAWLASENRIESFAAYGQAFFTAEGEIRKSLCFKETLARLPEAGEILAREAARLAAVRRQLNAVRVWRVSAALLRLGTALLEAYRRHKELRALVDYDDLVLKARDLLAGDGAPSWVLYKLDGGLDHILIDEAQDTNPDQWQVVEALAGEFFAGRGARDDCRTVFAVGDPKQSIFSFQRADPAGFERMRMLFSRQSRDAALAWNDVALDLSFRSAPAVLAAVDAVFSAPEARDGVVTGDLAVSHRAHRSQQAGRVELWPLFEPPPVPDPAAWEPPVRGRREESAQTRLARAVAGTVRGWLDEGARLEAGNRPIRAGDILVLVRRRTGFVDDLVRGLKERGVPVAGADRMVLTEQLAVMDLLALGRFLLLPEDDLSLACLLKSPLVGLSETALFTLCHGRTGSLWQALQADPACAEIHHALAALLARVDYVRPYDLFAELLGPGGGRRKLLARLGPDAADPLDEFLSLALTYERANIPSLQGFLHWLDSGSAEIKRDLEQAGRDQVRIMTVHGAKGLQAPIVFLPDTVRMPMQLPKVLWPSLPLWSPRKEMDDPVAAAARARAMQERDREYRRLLYVALTRAEDRLIVCGWRTGRVAAPGCWYELVRTGLMAQGAAAADFPGGSGLLLTNPQEAPLPEAPPSAAAAAASPLPAFAHRPPREEAPLSAPLVPSHLGGEEPPVRSPCAPEDTLRFRRGRLIHRLLQTLPDLADPDRAAACRRFLARPVHGLDPAEQEIIAAETLRVLGDPVFAPLFGPHSRAEVPLVGKVGDRVLSGQIDRLAVTAEAVLVIDYKTNRPPPARVEDVPEIYLRQMAAYRRALLGLYPGRRVDCALLWTDVPLLMPLPSAILTGVESVPTLHTR